MLGEQVRDDQYPTASLTKLIKRFGVDVMYLWYALLLEYALPLAPLSVKSNQLRWSQVMSPQMDSGQIMSYHLRWSLTFFRFCSFLHHPPDIDLFLPHVLLRQRVLFSGQPAGEVGQCCISVPLLVAPLKGFASITQPYVALTEMSKFQTKTYICGSTNALFETKADWFDVLGRYGILS